MSPSSAVALVGGVPTTVTVAPAPLDTNGTMRVVQGHALAASGAGFTLTPGDFVAQVNGYTQHSRSDRHLSAWSLQRGRSYVRGRGQAPELGPEGRRVQVQVVIAYTLN
ncbi:MAG: hypothetical protein HQ453_00810 [Actinobacteria bacterium]|nr:hypothetical protein [Actinomycetota bacterium]